MKDQMWLVLAGRIWKFFEIPLLFLIRIPESSDIHQNIPGGFVGRIPPCEETPTTGSSAFEVPKKSRRLVPGVRRKTTPEIVKSLRMREDHLRLRFGISCDYHQDYSCFLLKDMLHCA